MAGASVEDLHELLGDANAVAADPFGVVRSVSHAHALAEARADGVADEELRRARELIIRLVEHREGLGDAEPMLNALLAKIGLYPYLEPGGLDLSDLFAYEAHRPPGDFGQAIVWHREQAYAYALLMDGRNVILSAPTSFGKSRVIDGVLASGKFSNVVVVVPTIALIDETRRRLSRLLDESFKVLTHVGQEAGEKTVHVLTQERVLEFDELPPVDFFVVDEFYKLSIEELESGADDRARLLNLAFFKLLQTGAQFYLLGPNIGGISEATLNQLDCVWVDSWDTTVSVEVIAELGPGSKDERLFAVAERCADRGERTLVYCSSPERAEAVAMQIADAGLGRAAGFASEAADWMAAHYHPRWRAARALVDGVGVHHGQLPRALGTYMVGAFDRGEIGFLVCTPTLIEGVNTKAKNVIVYDATIGTQTPIDLFTYNNIRGRSGRMSAHISGKVYVFEEPPTPPLKEVDIPILSQSEETPADLFLGLEPEHVQNGPKERLAELLETSPLDSEVFEASPTVGLQDQLKLASAIEEAPEETAAMISWGGAYPRNEQLLPIFEMVDEQVFGTKRRMGRPFGAFSMRQLVFWINALANGDAPRRILDGQVKYAEENDLDVDGAILAFLKFLRSGLSFEAPRWLRAAGAIQSVVLPRRGIPAGDYEPYIGRLENLFLPYPLAALDEYGLPVELIRKLEPQLLEAGEDIDALLRLLVNLDPAGLNLTPFEQLLLGTAQEDLGLPEAGLGG
jgi:hypothetical protein